MGFMQLQILDEQDGWCIETVDGTFYVPSDVYPNPFPDMLTDETVAWRRVADIDNPLPMGDEDSQGIADDLSDYVAVKQTRWLSVELVWGFFGRYQAPGYMDCTEWEFDRNPLVLRDYLNDRYGDDEGDDE